MRFSFGQGALVCLTLSLALPVISSGLAVDKPATGGERFSPDASSKDGFLSLLFRGGGAREQWRYSFFGDGRVQIDRFNHLSTSTPLESWAAQLQTSDVETVLADVVNSGLLTLVPEDVKERDRQAGRIRPMTIDGGQVVVSISLVRARATDGEQEKVASSYVVPGNALDSSISPDISEYEALRRLVALSLELRTRASEIGK